MPTYEVTSPDGRVLRLEGAQPPTEGELKRIFAVSKRQNAPAIKTPEEIQNDMNASGDMDLAQKIGTALAPRTAANQIENEAKAKFNPSAGLPTPEEGVLPPDQIANVVAANQNPIEFKKRAASIGSDALSLAGRAITSLPALVPGGESYGEAMARTKAKEQNGVVGNTAEFIGNVARSPASGAAAATGGLGLIPAAVAGAGASQAENVSEGKPVSPLGFAGEAATGIVGGKVGEKVGEVVGTGLTKIANSKAARDLYDAVKPSMKQMNKIPFKNFLKYNIGGDVETASKDLSKMVSESGAAAERAAENVNQMVPVKRNIEQLFSDFNKPGLGSEYSSVVADITKRAQELGDGSGTLNLPQMLQFRRVLNEITDFSPLTSASPKNKILQKAYAKVNKTLEEMLADAPKLAESPSDIPTLNVMKQQFKEHDDRLKDLIPMKNLIESKMEHIKEKQSGEGTVWPIKAAKVVWDLVKHPVETPVKWAGKATVNSMKGNLPDVRQKMMSEFGLPGKNANEQIANIKRAKTFLNSKNGKALTEKAKAADFGDAEVSPELLQIFSEQTSGEANQKLAGEVVGQILGLSIANNISIDEATQMLMGGVQKK